jgi:hypothetical protein
MYSTASYLGEQQLLRSSWREAFQVNRDGSTIERIRVNKPWDRSRRRSWSRSWSWGTDGR